MRVTARPPGYAIVSLLPTPSNVHAVVWPFSVSVVRFERESYSTRTIESSGSALLPFYFPLFVSFVPLGVDEDYWTNAVFGMDRGATMEYLASNFSDKSGFEAPLFIYDVLPYLGVVVFISALSSVLLSPLVGRLATRLGAVDYPGGRHMHAVATPRMGGLAIAAGALLGILALSWVPGIAHPGHLRLVTLAVAGLGILLLGAVDDVLGVSAKKKLAFQLVFAALCWSAGVKISALSDPVGGHILLDASASLIITLAWIVGVTNAINLLDGLDGLAAGVVTIVATTLVFVGLLAGAPDIFLVLTTGALAGACLGFMLHNGHPARIFMGDTGSQFLGFLIANIAILSTQKRTAATALAIPILALGIPIADTLYAIIRRSMQGRSPFSADADHFHHLLNRLASGKRSAVLIILVGTATLCAFAILAAVYDVRLLLVGFGLLVASFMTLLLMARTRDRKTAEIVDIANLIEPVESGRELSDALPAPDAPLAATGLKEQQM